ncbi:putative transglycosylase [Edwardsiella phage GF-2]|uniref:Putative transglycosylase n=1 Tax=Edwardsiella phage GF-2 TaxID=1537091 RepID=A0A077KC92_9CAUD|nr:lytic tail protein [Edwardsiella phage GF-2]BAP28889.1 putative transglycosylase [Edwardsiella phage GF-2]
MIIQELAYKVKIQAEEFLAGKKKVAQSVAELDQDVKKPLESVGKRFDGLTDGVTAFGNAGKNAFNQVQMGAAKFLGVALTLEGARRLFTSTTRNLVDLGNTSSFLDMGAKSLDGFNRAAAATGASEQSMTSMLMRLKNAQNWMAMPMGAPDASTIAIQQLQGMTGVDIMGEKDPGKMLLRSATALRKLNKAQAEVMWGQMGGAPDMFGLVYSGKLPAMQKEFEKRSNATDPAIKRANEVNETLEKLRQTVDNLGNDFVLAFGDDVNRLLKEFGDWVSTHKDDILGFFKDASSLAKQFADSVGGTTNALILLTAAWYKSPAGMIIGGAMTANSNIESAQEEAKRRGVGVGDILAERIKNKATEASNGESGLDWVKRKWGELWGSEPDQHAQSAKKSMLMNSVALTESGGNPNAVSSAGAAGAYQLMPGTARDLGLTPEERFDPEKSRAAASIHISRLLKHYNGNVTYALMAYNAGQKRIDDYLAGTGKPLTDETLNYPGKVLSYYQQQTAMASRPSGMPGGIDNSQQSHISIQKVEVNSNPQTIDQLTNAIAEQATRSRMNVSFSSGNQ